MSSLAEQAKSTSSVKSKQHSTAAKSRTQQHDRDDSRSRSTARADATRTAAQQPPAPALSFRAMAFGRNYYHAMGGMCKSHYTGTSSDESDGRARLQEVADDDDTADHCHHHHEDDKYEENDSGCPSSSNPTTYTTRPTGRLSRYTSWDSQSNTNLLAANWTKKQQDDDEATVTNIACTAQSTVFLSKAGKIYQTGMMHGRMYYKPTLVTVPLPLRCVQIAAGRHFVLARLEGGRAVVSFGAGHFGQLGVVVSTAASSRRSSRHGSNSTAKSGTEQDDDDDDDDDEYDDDDKPTSTTPITFTRTPVVIERLLPHVAGSPCASIAAGDWHALALTEAGRVWAWGANRMGQCGRRSQPPPSSTSSSSQQATGAPTIVAPLPVTIESDDDDINVNDATGGGERELKVVQISAGRAHSAAIVEGGQVYCWGSSQHGQCGNVVRRSGIVPPRKVQALLDLNISQVSCGANHTMALTTGGRVFCWGGGTEGQLGLGMVQAQVKPRQVCDIDFVAIAAGQEWKQQQRRSSPTCDLNDTSVNHDIDDGVEPANDDLAMMKRNLSKQPKITKIFAGALYSAAISSSGHVYTWGSNDASQAGIPTPAKLPMKDNLTSTGVPVKTSTNRELHCCTFDSNHNILLPTRVDAASNMFVNDVIGGPNHLWLLGSDRTPEHEDLVVGRTLYEVQEEQRIRKLHRARNSLLSKVQGIGIDDGWTEEMTTQTENEETTQEDVNSPSYQYDLSMSPITNFDPTDLTPGADMSRLYINASVNPVGPFRRPPPATPSTAGDLSPVGEDVTMSPFFRSPLSGTGSPVTQSSKLKHRRRFSLPRMFQRLSLGKHKPPTTDDQHDRQQQLLLEPGDTNHSLRKKKSKRNSL